MSKRSRREIEDTIEEIVETIEKDESNGENEEEGKDKIKDEVNAYCIDEGGRAQWGRDTDTK